MGEYLLDLPAAAVLLLHTDMDGLMRPPTDLAGYRLLNRRDGGGRRRRVQGGVEGWGGGGGAASGKKKS
jgi:hypothetical protein